jgi:diguanylate cyclase (GGDEF)-like protein/PAS domain S-box-containing protein
MAVKPKLSVKNKASIKPKAAVKPVKKISPRQSEFTHLAEAIISNINVGIYIVQNRKFIYMSPLFQKLSGYSDADLAGTNPLDYVHPDDKEVIRKKAIAILKGKSSDAYEYKFTRKNGEVLWVLERITSITYKGDRAVLASFMDITERKKMEETISQSEERYRTILDEMEDAYFEVDLAGNFIFLNDAICRLMKYPREELLGKSFRIHVDKDDIPILYNAFGRIYSTGNPERNICYKAVRKDGTTRYAEIAGFPLQNQKGEMIGFRGIGRDITERRQMEEALRQSEERYRTIIEEMDEWYFETDLPGNINFFNDIFANVLGYSPKDLSGLNFQSFIKKEESELVQTLFKQVLKTGKPVKNFPYEFIRTDGTVTSAEFSIFPKLDKEGKVCGLRGVGHDITELKQAEEALSVEQSVLRTVIDNLPDPIYSKDTACRKTMANLADLHNLGAKSEADVLGKDDFDFFPKEIAEKFFADDQVVIQTGTPVINREEYFFDKKEQKQWLLTSKLPLRDKDGQIIGLVGIGRDITERKRAEEKIQHMATHDALTGLPNRLMFSQTLKHVIQSAHRYKRQFAVLFIDLDRFKIINDTLGHEAGDQLLQEITARLKQTLRAVDVAARLGGDEFVILIEEVSDSSHVATIARKILTNIIKPITIMGQECLITASIGISVYPKDAEDEQSLMKNADIAMYLAKEEGKNNYQFYSEDIQSKSLERLSIETNLRFALERNELSLHYQAKVDFKTNAITGVEALLRWQNPYLGSVTPTQFIPVAEETGLIISIGKWVMRTACAQNVAWQQQGLPPVCMAVNLSLRQLTDDNLIDDIKTALNDSGMEPNLLELEITESMVMYNTTRMIAVLAKIKNLGVRLAIDDFGTSYSSLAQIKHFPIDTLKVDRSFIRNIPQDAEDKAITKAIIAMGKTLSLTVVAEGVETVEQMNFLKDRSCDEMQGFYFSKPIAPEQFADLLRKHVPSPGK